MSWNVNGDFIRPVSISTVSEVIPSGIWTVGMDNNGWFLKRVEDTFELPKKIYGINSKIVNRVIKSWDNKITNDMGVVFHGLKGTGKSVSLKQIANMTGLPVLLVNAPYDLSSFLTEIHQDVVIFIDEFEKVYCENKDQERLLTCLDGVFISSHRRVLWLLSANKKLFNDNLTDRPSRVRYFTEFGNLTVPEITEIVDDLLTTVHWREQAISVISCLQMITVDIVRQFINEINLHDENPADLIQDFNASEMQWETVASIYRGDKFVTSVACEKSRFRLNHNGMTLGFTDLGKPTKVSEGVYSVNISDYNAGAINDGVLLKYYTVDEDSDEDVMEVFTVKLSERRVYNTIYASAGADFGYGSLDDEMCDAVPVRFEAELTAKANEVISFTSSPSNTINIDTKF